MERIRMGVIGVGNMGKNHLRICAELPEFALAGFWDTNPARRDLAAQYGVEAFDTLERLLCAVDAVSIAVPSSLHAQIAAMAAGAGKHMLVEKPVAMNVEETDAIIAACRKAQKKLMVGHVERFNPAVVELAKVLRAEEVIAIDVHRCSPSNRHVTDADVVDDLMVHDLDIVANVLNPSPVIRLDAQGITVHGGMLDYAQALLRFENGVMASITASRITEDKIREILVHCKNGLIRANLLDRTLSITRQTRYKEEQTKTQLYRQENTKERVFLPQVEPLRQEFIAFAASILNDASPPVSGEEARRAIELVTQTRQACR